MKEKLRKEYLRRKKNFLNQILHQKSQQKKKYQDNRPYEILCTYLKMDRRWTNNVDYKLRKLMTTMHEVLYPRVDSTRREKEKEDSTALRIARMKKIQGFEEYKKEKRKID